MLNFKFKPFGIIEEVESQYNGKIQIVGDFGGPRILAGGISQSGWLVRKVWEAGIKKIKSRKPNPKNVLILGLGGGSAAELAQKYFPSTNITGIDIDPLMVELGKKYLQLGTLSTLNVIITDAEGWVNQKRKERFDVILVDLFHGDRIPQQFYKEEFIKNVKGQLAGNGVAAFNHLYTFLEKDDAKILSKNLRKTFSVVTTVQPEANIIFVCFAN